MGDSLLCHYIDNCFKKGIILWGRKHCDWGGQSWGMEGHLPPSSNVKKGSVTQVIPEKHMIKEPKKVEFLKERKKKWKRMKWLNLHLAT